MKDVSLAACALAAEQYALHVNGVLLYSALLRGIIHETPHRSVAPIGYNKALEDAVLMEPTAAII